MKNKITIQRRIYKMPKNKNKGITLIALVITIIILLILAGISIQAITHIGMFAKAKQAELENKRAQVSEYLKLKLINEQINNPFGSAEEIITATRNNVLENIKELKKIGKEVTVGEISTERLILRHSDQDRDGWKLLMMLEEEGDFRIFTGVEYSEKYRDDFLDYFEVTHGNRCYYSLFPKEDPEKFIGYAGFHTSFVRRSGFWKNLVL